MIKFKVIVQGNSKNCVMLFFLFFFLFAWSKAMLGILMNTLLRTEFSVREIKDNHSEKMKK